LEQLGGGNTENGTDFSSLVSKISGDSSEKTENVQFLIDPNQLFFVMTKPQQHARSR